MKIKVYKPLTEIVYTTVYIHILTKNTYVVSKATKGGCQCLSGIPEEAVVRAIIYCSVHFA